MKNKNIYLVAFYHMRPRPGVNTARKGWMSDPNNLRYDERVEITRGLKKDTVSAKVILDLSNKQVVKNGFEQEKKEFNEFFKYFFKGYHQYVTQVMTQIDAEYFNQMLDEMQAEMTEEAEQTERQAREDLVKLHGMTEEEAQQAIDKVKAQAAE